jgi:hypothetical protein
MPRITNFRALERILEIECDSCREGASVYLCQSHYDMELKEEYDKGFKDGKKEAEEEAKEGDKGVEL